MDEFEEDAYCEVFELFTEFDGSSRDHYADQKKDSFQIDLCGHDIRISQDGRLQLGLGITGARVWDAAVVLAKLLEHLASGPLGLTPETPTLELGAGCGLSGMATALLASPTLLTDQAEMMPHLVRNLDSNNIASLAAAKRRATGREQLPGGSSSSSGAATAPLQWGEPLSLDVFPKWARSPDCSDAGPSASSTPGAPSRFGTAQVGFSLVLCADLAYNESVVEELLDALVRVVGPGTLVLFSMELRTPPVLQDLLQRLLAASFVIMRVPRSHYHPDFAAPSVVVYALRRPGPEPVPKGAADLMAGESAAGASEARGGRVVDFDESVLRLTPLL